MAKQLDQWLLDKDGNPDPFAANIDWNMPDLPDLDDDLNSNDPVLDEHDGLQPEIVVVEGGVRREHTPEPIVPEIEPEPEGPRVYEVDGGTVTLEKEKGQWKLTISNETGGSSQVYWGKTKDELLVFGMGKAQLNATKKIREQNAKLKFGSVPAPKPPTPASPVVTSARQLTGEEVFEIKTLWETNPAAAFDTLLQKTRGVTMDQVLAMAQRGEQAGSQASNTLFTESQTNTFIANNPDYYADPNWENYRSLVKWIAKFKLGESVRQGEEDAAFDKLVSARVWTVENLEEAFKDLSEDGILVQAPRRPTPPPPVAVPTEPAPAPRPDSRIVSQVTRPRAATGLRRDDVTPVKTPEAPKAPSVEDFEDLSDEEVAKTFAGVRRYLALQSRRSN